MDILTAFLQLATLAVIGYGEYRRNRYSLDPRRLADNMSVQLFADYDDVNVLSEDGVRDFVRERYVRMVSAFAFPYGALERIQDLTWQRIAQVQKPTLTTIDGAGFYE